MPVRGAFHFVPFNHTTGAAGLSREARKQKNRHAQLGYVANEELHDIQARRLPVLPVQIKFRNDFGESFGSDQSEETYHFRRCRRCKKRRKVYTIFKKLISRVYMLIDETTAIESVATIFPDPEHGVPPTWTQTLLYGHEQIASPPRWTTSASRQEQLALHYFYNFAALDLSGYIPGHFWDKFVLQTCETEPMVLPSIVAIGKAHLDYRNTGELSLDTVASYSKALAALHQYMKDEVNPTREVVLICCILFYTFDKLREDMIAAAVHLRCALSILRSSRKSVAESSRAGSSASFGNGQRGLHDLSVVLMQIEIEDFMQDLDTGPRLPLEAYGIRVDYLEDDNTSTMQWYTPHDCMESWMYICHDIWRFIGANAKYRHKPLEDIPQPIITERSRHLLRIKRWRLSLNEYITAHPIPKPEDLPSPKFGADRILKSINILVMWSHYYTLKWLAEEAIGVDPKPFDKRPEKLLWVGETALALRRAHKAYRNIQIKRTFSPHVGIVETLLNLAHRTSFPHIRARAQALIRSFKEVQEGLSGLSDFWMGQGAPPDDFVLIYEKAGH